jgi:hypothetical protein
MRVSPIINQHYDTPGDPPSSNPTETKYAFANNPYYQLPDEEKAQILTRYHNGKLIDRIYIQEYLLRDCPQYLENEPPSEQRRFLGRQFKCQCSDCDGPDVSGACLVEEAFYEKSGIDTPKELINNYSSSSSLSVSLDSDYLEPDRMEEVTSLMKKSRVSLTYEDIKKIVETEVEL